jgi:nitroimidazol reductase NimA-like FMN-containing flavoprotein (pyridoxamine 5'-phosphate oxidase superfamily)
VSAELPALVEINRMWFLFILSLTGGEHIYSFSTYGQKIEWMRTNPLVCVEVDNIKNQFEWTSFVIFGRFEELTETPEFEENRLLTYQLLSQYPMWGSRRMSPEPIKHPKVKMTSRSTFVLLVEKITGHRAESEEKIEHR